MFSCHYFSIFFFSRLSMYHELFLARTGSNSWDTICVDMDGELLGDLLLPNTFYSVDNNQ
jgi:hypothetical protein